MGKGCKPRKGHNFSKFGDAYDNINWGPKEPVNEDIQNSLSVSQVEYGLKEIDKLSEKYGIEPRDIALILEGIEDFKDFYNWVNADDFLSEFIYDSTSK